MKNKKTKPTFLKRQKQNCVLINRRLGHFKWILTRRKAAANGIRKDQEMIQLEA